MNNIYKKLNINKGFNTEEIGKRIEKYEYQSME